LRVVYAGDTRRKKIRLLANEQLKSIRFLNPPISYQAIEFELPQAATESGELTLTWFGEPGLGGNGGLPGFGVCCFERISLFRR